MFSPKESWIPIETTTPSTTSSPAPTTAATRTAGACSTGDVHPWLAKEAETYGYPLDWLPEAQDGPYPLSADPRLGAQMRDRMGVGDIAGNLAAAGLVRNAWILSGEDRYATGSSSTWARGASVRGPTRV